MFVGSNKLVLNSATVMLAVQEYINQRATAEVVVDSVQADLGGDFVFSILPAKEPKKEPR